MILLIIIFGLIIGSFINVIIYRLPKIILKNYRNNSSAPKISLIKSLTWPRSFAPCCKKKLTWFENIPIISWILLLGRCRYCRKMIGYHYPLVEILTALSFFLIFKKIGFNSEFLLWAIFFSYVISLTFIDLKTFLLPDIMTLSLIFIGLLGSLMHMIKIPIESALWGLLLGYTLPWLVNKFYFIWRKHDGFGGGDFKLLAALGVWLGWQNILPILTIASVLALLVALTLMLKGKKIHLKTKLPFGPFLIMASVIMFYYPIDKFIL